MKKSASVPIFILALSALSLTVVFAAAQADEEESYAAFLDTGQRLRLNVQRWTTAEEIQNLRQVYDKGGWVALQKEMQKTVVGHAWYPFTRDKPLEDRQPLHMASYKQTEKGRSVQLVTIGEGTHEKSIIAIEFTLDEQGKGEGMMHMSNTARISTEDLLEIDLEARTSQILLRVSKTK